MFVVWYKRFIPIDGFKCGLTGRCHPPGAKNTAFPAVRFRPFLFSILMTVLLYDEKIDLRSRGGLNLPATLVMIYLVYADVKLVVAVEQKRAEVQMNCITLVGSKYAFMFSWKVELMRIRCQASIRKPNGCEIPSNSSLVYLGHILSASGDITLEVSRRLGMAPADFIALGRVWKHSALTSRNNLRVFNACVVSRLRYCLHTACRVEELRRFSYKLSPQDSSCSPSVHKQRFERRSSEPGKPPFAVQDFAVKTGNVVEACGRFTFGRDFMRTCVFQKK